MAKQYSSRMAKVIGNKLKIWMTKRERTQLDIANKLNVTPQTVSNWVRGVAMPSIASIEKICDYLHCAPLDLLTEEGNPTSYVPIPVLGRIIAGEPVTPLSAKIGEVEIPTEWANTGEYFALRVTGNSMYPEMREGDTVIVKSQNDVDSGNVAVVFVGSGEATMKKVVKSESGITLYAYNADVYAPHFYSNEDIEDLPVRVIGRVVQVRRMV